jgi:uncharacterized OB-fold protein
MAETILSVLLVVAILGGSALLTQLFARVMYRRCPECGILNARRRRRCRQCGFPLVEAQTDEVESRENSGGHTVPTEG